MTVQSSVIRVALLAAAFVVGQSSAIRAADTTQMTAVSPQTLKYESIPDMPRCASAAILRGNPRSGPAWVMLKLTSGCRVPWHWHTANESLLIVSGRGTLEMKEGQPLRFAPGAYSSMPSKHVHRATCSRTCLLFSIADAAFDIHYVDASGQEIAAEQALTPPTTTKHKGK